jgi:excisionase family DNA binding protein
MSNTASTTIAYKVRQVANRLGIDRVGVYALIRSGRLIARKYGKRTLILESDLEAFIQSLPKAELENMVNPVKRGRGRPKKSEVSATEITGAHAST